MTDAPSCEIPATTFLKIYKKKIFQKNSDREIRTKNNIMEAKVKLIGKEKKLVEYHDEFSISELKEAMVYAEEKRDKEWKELKEWSRDIADRNYKDCTKAELLRYQKQNKECYTFWTDVTKNLWENLRARVLLLSGTVNDVR